MTKPPRPTFLYRLFDKNGLLLYVGIGYSMGRIGGHEDKPWFSLVTRIEPELFPTRALADAAETLAIETENPVYNVAKRSLAKVEKSTKIINIFRGRMQNDPVLTRDRSDDLTIRGVNLMLLGYCGSGKTTLAECFMEGAVAWKPEDIAAMSWPGDWKRWPLYIRSDGLVVAPRELGAHAHQRQWFPTVHTILAKGYSLLMVNHPGGTRASSYFREAPPWFHVLRMPELTEAEYERRILDRQRRRNQYNPTRAKKVAIEAMRCQHITRPEKMEALMSNRFHQLELGHEVEQIHTIIMTNRERKIV